jgi:hypothetical protein
LLNAFIVAVGSQDQDFGSRNGFEYLSRGLESIEEGHRYVHHDYVGRRIFLGQADCLAAIFGLADDFHVFLRRQQSA